MGIKQIGHKPGPIGRPIRLIWAGEYSRSFGLEIRSYEKKKLYSLRPPLIALHKPSSPTTANLAAAAVLTTAADVTLSIHRLHYSRCSASWSTNFVVSMNEDEVVKNLIQKKEKKIKEAKSNKCEKNEESLMGIHEGNNINDVDAIEHVKVSWKCEVAEMKMDRKKDKVKKNKKRTDFMADAKQGIKEGELLTVAYGEDDGSGGAMDNVERKRKKRGKNKTSSTKEVGGDEKNKKMLDSDANKEGKKHKLKRKRENEDLELEEAEKEFSQNCKSHERKKEKKMNKHDNSEAKHDEGDSSLLLHNVEESAKHDDNATKEFERKKKKKKNKRDDSSSAEKDNVDHDSNGLIQSDEVEYANKKKKKKKHTQLMGNGFDDLQEYVVNCEKKENKKKTKSNDATPIKSKKKVRFSNENEFFPILGNSKTKKVNDGEENLVRGKRFTPEEDEIIRDAVFDYIERHDLGDEGVDMVLNCKKYSKLRGCWKEISSAIPYRPYGSVYFRAQKVFCRGEYRKWTQEEYDEILKYQAKHGSTKWRTLADELGRYTGHVINTWCRIKLSNRKKGHWSQDEYQKLFDLVNADLQAKISEPKISKHGMLRDNIGWTAISDVLLTRLQRDCCRKWYGQLSSRMVAEGEWADSDDYRLIGALYSLDATCIEDVEWDNLVEGRTGDVCRKRWVQMVLHIGKHGHKSFAEQVEVLAQRYCPSLLEAREIWDSKPRVP
ncbi:hypothetical protein CASFOL_002786 [Castilleja foliolosa]|uniref:Myb-like domain-containing protein n=1 Tax=Castilleja foliolosa TaxID=1961234 RepID=A0ABD3EFP1_9LAMI